MGRFSIVALASLSIRGVDVAELPRGETHAGRNRIVVHRAGSASGKNVSRRTDVEWIRTALDGGRMLLYCQPILGLADSEVCQCELLLRLRITEGSEPLLPSAFLYVAERFDLVQDIDCWVVSRALELIAELVERAVSDSGLTRRV